MSDTWWKHAVVYQIYPRSFADTDGDGIGNLAGVTSRVPYLKQLGVDAVWLSPFYPSALADGGYDVDDHRDVDPRLGTLGAFDAMVRALHDAGIKVVVDIVPNHSSDRHEWFRAALAAGRGSRERERYIFRDGLGPNGELPPSDWESCFGGGAWEPVGDGQWYFHFFAKEQPDLNWDDAEVREDFLDTLRFWSDRGVDGFRVDVAHGLAKDLSEPLAPWSEVGMEPRTDGSHPLWDRDAVHEIYASWRRVFDAYDPPRFAVAEAFAHPSRRARYASPDGLGQAFNFEMQEAGWRSADFARAIDSGLAQAAESGSTTTWLLGCHDTARVATRYGLPEHPKLTAIEAAKEWLLTDGSAPALDRALGERRARAAALVTWALPGSTYIYQGEELGLHEVGDLPEEVLQDPVATRSGGREKGRDGCRVPLPWTADGPSFGFGPGPARPPQPDWFGAYAVSVQERDEHSTLNLYRTALRLRSTLDAGPGFAWVDTGSADVLHFRRAGGWHCVTNFGADPVRLPEGELLLASSPVEPDGRLPGDATAWVRALD
ncbi:glycoside hydrolase family 13 protein [Streptomyces sp. LHD-70]|uniref:glycoside hydrolase family 13 protein n=1 Tax=Streptomyces sp. LHD-70 TaxID=3072140 RepID=UPI00280CB627|nr:glycoside hydrolase family 13 protein [Streptomyces sp. LHD-70]MDQ8703832.1 glycoside hydrolase family 13 protein [Streptomyces sp. LHD-70]